MKLPFSGEHTCEWKQIATDAVARLEDFERRAGYEDPDTGLGNRRQFERDIVRTTARQQRQDTSFSIAIIEARHLVQRDTPLDDADLDDIARQLLDAVRLEDHVSRLGNFQFGVVLEGAHHGGALAFADRICSRMSASPLTRQGTAIYLDVTAGVAESSKDSHGVRNLTAAAQADLHRHQQHVRAEQKRYAGTG